MLCRKNGVITVLCDALAWAGPCVAVPPFLFTLAVEVCWTCAVRIRAIEAALLSLVSLNDSLLLAANLAPLSSVLLRLMLGSMSGEDGAEFCGPTGHDDEEDDALPPLLSFCLACIFAIPFCLRPRL